MLSLVITLVLLAAHHPSDRPQLADPPFDLCAAEGPVLPSPDIRDPQNDWETARRHQQNGEEHRKSGELASAVVEFQAAAKIMERLVALQSDNILWKRDLSLSEDKIGDVLLAQGNLAGAQENFRSALKIREQLVGADPKNREWQRNLSVSHNKIGDFHRAQGDLKAALESYLAAYGIVQDLTRAEAANTQWQRDLAMSQHRIGSVFFAAENWTGAADMFGAAVVLEERLARDMPNAQLQRDLAFCHGDLALALLGMHDSGGGADHLKTGRTIIVGLLEKEPNSEQLQKDLAWFDSELASLR